MVLRSAVIANAKGRGGLYLRWPCPVCGMMDSRNASSQSSRGVVMDFYEMLDQVVTLLRSRGRVTYRALKVQFALDDDRLDALKEELLYSHPQVIDDNGRGLVWSGDTGTTPEPSPAPVHSAQQS